MIVKGGGPGPLTQKLIDALGEGPKTLGELALILYGVNDDYGRENAQQIIGNLRMKRQYRITRDSIYTLKGR
jgi:hypothetical protein